MAGAEDVGIARLIAGDGVELPEWLVMATETARATLDWILRHEQKYPSRKELRKRLKNLSIAIEFVRGNLRDLTISTMLLSGDAQFYNQNEMYHGLGDLAARVANTIEKIRSGKGRDKSFVRPDGLIPQVICALMVCIVWNRMRGEDPPNSNRAAQQVCAHLWATADGEGRRRWGATADDASVAVWRDHLRTAKSSMDLPEAGALQRLLAPPGGGIKPSNLPI